MPTGRRRVNAHRERRNRRFSPQSRGRMASGSRSLAPSAPDRAQCRRPILHCDRSAHAARSTFGDDADHDRRRSACAVACARCWRLRSSPRRVPACCRRAGLRARSRRHRRRRREGDRRGRQHLDLADRRGQGRRRRQGRDAAIAAGLAVRGILRRLLQEPPRPERPKGGDARSRARPIRSAPASSSMPPASS